VHACQTTVQRGVSDFLQAYTGNIKGRNNTSGHQWQPPFLHFLFFNANMFGHDFNVRCVHMQRITEQSSTVAANFALL
jgi:hypothetical protein